MERDGRTPPPYAEVAQTSQDKLDPQELGESQRHLSPGNVPSPNMGATKLGEPSIDEFRRLSLSPGPSPCPSPLLRSSLPVQFQDAQIDPSTPRWKKFWLRNRPAILVALSQFFGALMNLSARLVELEGDGMHPVQVLLMRQFMTSVCCIIYMWLMKTPDFPFGRKEIRWLLVLRGCSGYFGIYGVWYSMMYIPLADATVIQFLAPGVAGIFCYFALREPFTRIEQLGTLVALLGVVLIAQPASLFSKSAGESEPTTEMPPETGLPGADHESTAEERLVAVAVGLLGVLGAAGAFTALRTIGKRAHPLISVNYFGVISTIISVSVLVLAPALDIGQPTLRWLTPATLKQWMLLLPLGILGFIMQYLLTAGLGSDKSNKANAMVYTHMLFAASFDRWVFGHRMGLMSAMGCTLILGSAIGVVLTKKAPAPKAADDVERQGNLDGEAEGSPMLLSAGNAGGTVEELRLERIR
ncbi:hypothetical protein G7046_g7905 [Stylonectria norvegica]|nr:hypothetical protein G7046_g7905 [Stylonectria norvegica]